jgi:hypothetical protein
VHTEEESPLSTEQPKRSLDDLITAACHGLVGSFERLNGLMAEPHAEEMSAEDIARNLAEFGRGQISGEAGASDRDREFIERLVADVDLDGELAPRFCAYVSGCVLGWVAVGELDRTHLADAIEIVRARSVELFPKVQADRLPGPTT